MIEDYGADPEGADMEFGKHPRNQAYIAEMERWAAANASGDALYEATYGAEALAAAKHAEEESGSSDAKPRGDSWTRSTAKSRTERSGGGQAHPDRSHRSTDPQGK